MRCEAKQLVVDQVLAADVNRLTNLFVELCERTRRYRDSIIAGLHPRRTTMTLTFRRPNFFARAQLGT